MNGARCLVFRDEGDWIVFAPVSHLVLRTNEEAARKFEAMLDVGSNLSDKRTPSAVQETEAFPPANVTVVCTNMCGQKCVYCYGTPAHRNGAQLDPDFCRVALGLAAREAAGRGETLRVFFHGVGEPTFIWPLFRECVGLARRAGADSGVRTHVRLCTGGQVDEAQGEWIAEHIDELDVSLDGPRDIQNQQRPRLDGRDSFDRPLRLAQVFAKTEKPLVVKTTVTRTTVPRMIEIVDFVARDIGRVTVHFGMMFRTPWADRQLARSPQGDAYVAQFGAALDHGAALGVKIEHPTISYESLCSPYSFSVKSHFCLAPPNIVTASFDIPEEGGGEPQQGAYGWYDAHTRTIRFDHEKRRRLTQEHSLSECVSCPCGSACLGASGVKGRVPEDIPVLGPVCQARIGVMKELLRRVAPRRPLTKEVKS